MRGFALDPEPEDEDSPVKGARRTDSACTSECAVGDTDAVRNDAYACNGYVGVPSRAVTISVGAHSATLCNCPAFKWWLSSMFPVCRDEIVSMLL